MYKPQHYIAHFDIDSFFVSVEVLKNPELKGKAVIVGGHSERGVVTACSYEARRFGIHSAMPTKKALQLCPQAIVVGGSRGDYSKYSRWITEIIASKAPLFEKASIDEFYLDLTGMDKYFDPFKWSIDLRQHIIDTTQLPISFGLASNKMIAKIATDEAKPNGYLQVMPGQEKEFLSSLKVSKIPGVGQQTHHTLLTLGITYISDIEKAGLTFLEQTLGNYGAELWNKSQGLHTGAVVPYHEAKSVSTENTFETNTNDKKILMAELVRMIEKIGYELRKEEKLAGCIAVKMRYADFSTFTRQASIDYTLRDDEMIPVAKDLFYKLYEETKPVRLLGVRLSELTNHPIQTSLFDDAKKKSDLYKAIDEVKAKFGITALKKARTL